MLLKKGHCGCDHLLTERSKLVLMSLNLVMTVITVALVCAMNWFILGSQCCGNKDMKYSVIQLLIFECWRRNKN